MLLDSHPADRNPNPAGTHGAIRFQYGKISGLCFTVQISGLQNLCILLMFWCNIHRFLKYSYYHLQLPELREVVEEWEGDYGGQVAPHWPGVGKLEGESICIVLLVKLSATTLNHWINQPYCDVIRAEVTKHNIPHSYLAFSISVRAEEHLKGYSPINV